MISFGRVVILPRGEWQSNKEYKRCDIVTFKGKAYLAKQDSISAIPNQDMDRTIHVSRNEVLAIIDKHMGKENG